MIRIEKGGKMEIFDITFIGAGPAGLFGSFYAGLRDLSVKIIDSLPQPGGQLIALYPNKMIYDTPGFPAILAKDLAADLTQQAVQWEPVMALGEQALTLERLYLSDDEVCWVIETDKAEHHTQAVIITAGIGAFQPVKLKNESVDRFEGKGVDYRVDDLDAYQAKRVLIIGGGDSAVDWALELEPVAKHVTLIHRREGFRAHDTSVNALKDSSVDVRIFHELRELRGDSSLESAVVFDNRTDEETTLDIDATILALGYKADLGPILEWGLETSGRRNIKVNVRMETNLPRVYAAGDIAIQEGIDPLKLIVVGFGQVTVAVNYAYATIRPGGKVFPGHSSE
jgi:thioredoxin reductase